MDKTVSATLDLHLLHLSIALAMVYLTRLLESANNAQLIQSGRVYNVLANLDTKNPQQEHAFSISLSQPQPPQPQQLPQLLLIQLIQHIQLTQLTIQITQVILVIQLCLQLSHQT